MGSFAEHYASPGFKPYVRERRLIGSAPVALFDIAQPPGDFSDPPLDDMIIAMVQTPHRNSWTIEGQRSSQHLERGFVHVLKPGTACSTTIDNPNAFLVAAIPASPALRLLEELVDGNDIFGRAPSIELRAGCVDPLLPKLLWKLADPGSETPKLVADSTLVILVHAIAAAAENLASLPAKGGLAPWQLKRVIDCLNDRLSANISLRELAEMTGLSEHHLCRAFKTSTGMPPHRYQLAIRINRARKLLVETSLSIAEVAEAVGYYDVAYFTRLFRREAGVPPGQWRKER